MYSKDTLALNQVTPSQVKSSLKNSRIPILLLQPTTNQITPLAFALENHNHSPLAPTLETRWNIRKLGIARIIQLQYHALFIYPAKFEKIQSFFKVKLQLRNTLIDDVIKKKRVRKT